MTPWKSDSWHIMTNYNDGEEEWFHCDSKGENVSYDSQDEAEIAAKEMMKKFPSSSWVVIRKFHY